MITDEELELIEATKEFDDIEGRGSFYNMAISLINNNFEMEAYFLILATWNSGCFSKVRGGFDIIGFKEKIKELNPYFEPLRNEDFRTINLDKYEDNIKKYLQPSLQLKGSNLQVHRK